MVFGKRMRGVFFGREVIDAFTGRSGKTRRSWGRVIALMNLESFKWSSCHVTPVVRVKEGCDPRLPFRAIPSQSMHRIIPVFHVYGYDTQLSSKTGG